MTNKVAGISQATAARLAGLIHVFGFPFALFPAFYVWPRIHVPNDAAETAINIVASERLFRLGIASELITWALDVVLLLALYVLLKPVNRHLALLAAFWRMIETSILVVTTLFGFVALLVLSGADYLNAFEANQLAALARLALAASGIGYDIGLMFLGLGSAVFAYLFFKSEYVPRALGAWGIFSSLVLLAGALAMVVFPTWRAILTPGYFAPIFIYELTLGFWLLIKGARIQLNSQERRHVTRS